MQVEIQIDEQYREPKVLILTERVTDEVSALLQRLRENHGGKMVGFNEDTAHILDEEDIVRIYTESQKVYAETEEGNYLLRLRLYEAENQLNASNFVRVSNSEIINLGKVRNLDLSFSGTICVNMQNGKAVYASRRYVAKIKQILGL